MGEPKIKGMAIINTRGWLDERLGAEWFTRTTQAHDPDWPDRLLPGDWYALRPEYRTLERAYEQLEGFDSLEEMITTISIAAALSDLNGMMRAFLWVASPRMFLRSAPKVWSTYVDFTTIESTDNEPGHFVAKLVEIPADLVTWAAGAWRGFLPSALELTGAKGPVVTIPERRQTPGAQTWELICDVRYD